MIVQCADHSPDLIPYDIVWHSKGSYNLEKSKRIWGYNKANSFVNRLVGKGLSVVSFKKGKPTMRDFNNPEVYS